jgi:type VI secretion system protein ImpE
MVQAYRETIQCERLREQVFKGQKVPLLFGEPETWMALLIEALLREGRGDTPTPPAARAGLRTGPGHGRASPGQWRRRASLRVDRRCRHAHRAGARSRGQRSLLLGALSRLSKVTIEAPTDLRDGSGCRRR